MITRRELLSAGVGAIAVGATGRILGSPSGAACAAIVAGEDTCIVPYSRPPARHLFVTAVHRLQPDEATAFAALQGLINREEPRLYLIYDAEDAFWLDWLRKRGDVDSIEWLGPYQAYRRFQNSVRGCVVTDASVSATVNVATLLAGLNDCIVAAPQLVGMFGLPVREDLRGRWKRDVDAYKWAYHELFASACQTALAHIHPGSSRLRDYITEFRLFPFWLSGSKTEDGEEEIQFAAQVFHRVGANIPVLGWWGAHGRGKPDGIGENRGVDLASSYGLPTDCMDWDGHCEGTSNVSVHSGTKATFVQKSPPPPPALEPKVYYAFVRTDGDGTNFWRQEFLHRWHDAAHGEIPVNWPVGPMASVLIPDIMDFFYRHASPNDYFMAAVSGIGYIHEELYGAKLTPESCDEGLRRFLALTRQYMKRMDLTYIHTYRTKSPQLIEKYAATEGVGALFLNYNRDPNTTAENVTETVRNVPVFRTVIGWPRGDSWDEKIRNTVELIQATTPKHRPAFLHCSLPNWGGTEMQTLETVQRVQRSLPLEYVAVRADHLVSLYKAHRTAAG